MPANSFPRDMDYRQEALQDKATSMKQILAIFCTWVRSSFSVDWDYFLPTGGDVALAEEEPIIFLGKPV